MPRVLVSGDTHATRFAISQAFHLAAQNAATRILVVGDFGYWPSRQNGRDFLATTAALSQETGIEVTFVDGNHEDHAALTELNPGLQLVEVQPGLFWAPRGARWVWDDRTFGALGGGYSVDRHRRVEGVTVFADLEAPTVSDLCRLGGEPLDVLVTHDVPASCVPIRFPPLPAAEEALAAAPKALIDRAIEQTTPKLVTHGHIHHRHTAAHATGAVVEGFTCDGFKGCFGLLDLYNLELTSL